VFGSRTGVALPPVSRSSRAKPPNREGRLVHRKLSITVQQSEMLDLQAAKLGIGKGEMLRRVLDDWRTHLAPNEEKKA